MEFNILPTKTPIQIKSKKKTKKKQLKKKEKNVHTQKIQPKNGHTSFWITRMIGLSI